MNRLISLTICLTVSLFSFVASTPADEGGDLIFESNIQPVLTAKCGKCHSAKARKGALDLSKMSGLLRGGESGEAAIGESLEESFLWQMIEGGDMPPEGQPPLSDNEKTLVKRWIESGAKSNAGGVGVVTQHDVLPYLYTPCVGVSLRSTLAFAARSITYRPRTDRHWAKGRSHI